MSNSPKHWLFETIPELLEKIRQDQTADTPPGNARPEIHVTFGINIWQKGAPEHSVMAFADDEEKVEIPGQRIGFSSEDIRASPSSIDDQYLYAMVLDVLKIPLQMGQIRDVQFLDLLHPDYFVCDPVTRVERGGGSRLLLRVPIMLSASVVMDDKALEINYHHTGFPVFFNKPQACSRRRLEAMTDRSTGGKAREFLANLFLRRESLTRAGIIQRCGTGEAAKKFILFEPLACLLDIDNLPSTGCALAVMEGAGNAITIFEGTGKDRNDAMRAVKVAHRGILYNVLVACEWNEKERLGEQREAVVQNTFLDALMDDDGRLRVKEPMKLDHDSKLLVMRKCAKPVYETSESE